MQGSVDFSPLPSPRQRCSRVCPAPRPHLWKTRWCHSKRWTISCWSIGSSSSTRRTWSRCARVRADCEPVRACIHCRLFTVIANHSVSCATWGRTHLCRFRTSWPAARLPARQGSRRSPWTSMSRRRWSEKCWRRSGRRRGCALARGQGFLSYRALIQI